MPDLTGLAARLGGRGPGLTPAGDDVLAGVLLAARARCGPSAEPELSAVAASICTTEPALAFLAWAARGQCIEPAHTVLLALTRRDEARAHAAATRLVTIGASSGAALLAGLRLGLGPPIIDWMSRGLAEKLTCFDQTIGSISDEMRCGRCRPRPALPYCPTTPSLTGRQWTPFPGGFGTRQEIRNGRLHEFICSQPETTLLTSVCTGSWIYGQMGLLDGISARSREA